MPCEVRPVSPADESNYFLVCLEQSRSQTIFTSLQFSIVFSYTLLSKQENYIMDEQQINEINIVDESDFEDAKEGGSGERQINT